MNTQDNTTDTGRSRFSYHGEDDPGEGGVVAGRRPASRGGSEGRQSEGRHAAGHRTATSATTPGVPGPDEPLLDISELARTVGMRYKHRFDFPAGRIEGVETSAPTVGELRLTNTGAVLLLRGEVKSTLRIECGRCLTPTDIPVETEIEEEFDLVAANDAFNHDEVKVVDEDTPAAVVEGNVLDLADLLRQDLLLAAPLQPLCREDCPGIEHESYLGLAPDVAEIAEGPAAVAIAPDNPLKRLADMLEEKRRRESGAA